MTMTLKELGSHCKVGDNVTFKYCGNIYNMTIKLLNDNLMSGPHTIDGKPRNYDTTFSLTGEGIELLEGPRPDPDMVEAIHKFTHLV